MRALLALSLLAPTAGAQQQFTLQQAVELAQKQGYSAAAAVATRDAMRAREHAFSMRRLPQLSLAGVAPEFRKDIQPVAQEDGSIKFLPVQQTTANAGLTVAQQIPLTGATFSVTSSLQRYARTGTSGQDLTWTSSPVTFLIQQPILRPNEFKWEGREQDLELDAAEQKYLEDREGVAIDATEAFFGLFVAKRQLENAIATAATNDTLFNINKGRLEIGKIGENDLLQNELALLRARAAADNARLEYARALAAFRLALNLPAGTDVETLTPATLPRIDADTAVAAAQALKNRARMRELALQDVQARRRIAQARMQGGPGATVNASVGFNQTAPDMNLAYQDLEQAQRASVSVSIPVFNWGARGAEVQAAKVDHRRVEVTSRQAREQLAQDGHFAALTLAQARRNLEVQAKADTVAQKRFEVAYNRYVIGRIGIDNLFIAQNEKDQAVTQYLLALRNYWLAYYRLRQTTLYDFETNAAIR